MIEKYTTSLLDESQPTMIGAIDYSVSTEVIDANLQSASDFKQGHLKNLMEKYGTISDLLALALEMVEESHEVRRQPMVSLLSIICQQFDVSTIDGATMAAEAFLYLQLVSYIKILKCHDDLLSQGVQSTIFNPTATWDDLNPCGLSDWGYYLIHCLGIEKTSQITQAFANKDWDHIKSTMDTLNVGFEDL